MNFRKRLQSLLLTSTLLSAVYAHGMDNNTAMDVDSSGHVSAAPPASTAAWVEVAKNICGVLDPQSLRRFQQASKTCQTGVLLFLDQRFPKGKDLIEHLKKLPTAKEAFAYLSTYAAYDLHAHKHFMDAFYTYLDVPRKERLFRIHYEDITLNPLGSPEEFAQKITTYVPYGMCLLASYFLDPRPTYLQKDGGKDLDLHPTHSQKMVTKKGVAHPTHLQKEVGKRFAKPDISQLAAVQKNAILFFVPYEEKKEGGPQPAGEEVSALNALFAAPQIWAREERKAQQLGDVFRCQILHKLQYPDEVVPQDVAIKELFVETESMVQNLSQRLRSVGYKLFLGNIQNTMVATMTELNWLFSSSKTLKETLWYGYNTTQKMPEEASHNRFVKGDFLKLLTQLTANLGAGYEALADFYFETAEKYANLQEKERAYEYYRAAAADYWQAFHDSEDGESWRIRDIKDRSYWKKSDLMDFAGASYFYMACLHGDPKSKEDLFKLAAETYVTQLNTKGDLVRKDDYMACHDSYFNAAKYATNPEDKEAYLKLANFYRNKNCQEENLLNFISTAGHLCSDREIVEISIDRLNEHCITIKSDRPWEHSSGRPGTIAGYFKEMSADTQAMLQRKGGDATARDYFKCGESHFNAAKSLPASEEQEDYFKQAVLYYKQSLDKNGHTLTAQERQYYGMVFLEIANNLTDPAEKAEMLARAEEFINLIKKAKEKRPENES